MFNNLYETLRGVLFQRWDERLPGILAGGERVESLGMTVPDAYAEGYRVAYFDAVSDLIAARLIKESTATRKPQEVSLLRVSDQVH